MHKHDLQLLYTYSTTLCSEEKTSVSLQNSYVELTNKTRNCRHCRAAAKPTACAKSLCEPKFGLQQQVSGLCLQA